MAPLIPGVDSIYSSVGLDDDDYHDPHVVPPGLTEESLRTLETISLSLATVSVLAAFVAFYWFVRMRRGFRQE